MKYTVWFMGMEVEEESPQEACWKALADAKKVGVLMIDEVVDSNGIIQMSSDYRRIGKKWSEK